MNRFFRADQIRANQNSDENLEQLCQMNFNDITDEFDYKIGNQITEVKR